MWGAGRWWRVAAVATTMGGATALGSAKLAFAESGGATAKEDDGIFDRARRWWDDSTRGLLSDPRGRKLLPDAARPGEMGYKKYTVVISEDLLLANVYAPLAGGHLTKKRPAAEWFLASLAQYYEVVLFSTGSFAERDPLLNKLDPRRHASHRLYRDSCISVGVDVQKDLSLLNRNLEQVICLDSKIENTLQPENTVVIPAYAGEDSDNTLLRLLAFLVVAAKLRDGDVRTTILEYKADPESFAKEFASYKDRQSGSKRK